MKHRWISTIACAAVMLVAGAKALAGVTLPRIIGNDMVLQRNVRVPIWGRAEPGEQVTVRFHEQQKNTTADADGQWKVLLDPMAASASPASLVITGANTIRLDHILVGEVWLCSGQSNMEYTMRKNSKVVKTGSSGLSPVDELQRASNPGIRIFLVTSKNLRAPDSLHTGWSIARDSALRSFSAAGYFFAKELFDKLRIPIGVISAAIPGSAIEPWLPGTVIPAAKPAGNALTPALNDAVPGKFYTSMIQPLAPFALKGFLWYQGETNCFQNETIEYTYKMKALMDSWRGLWKDSLMPFYYVQIAPFYYSRNKGKYPLTEETLPLFREAQALAMQFPHTGMVVTTDLVDKAEDLHPGFKWEVGRRLAQWALAKDYGMKVVPSGPMYRQVRIRHAAIEVEFNYVGSGLVSSDGKPLTWFMIAGEDGKFVPAKAVIRGSRVIVSSPEVPRPANVRFAWNEAAQPNLFNKEGLPANPFRTDHPLRLYAQQ